MPDTPSEMRSQSDKTPGQPTQDSEPDTAAAGTEQPAPGGYEDAPGGDTTTGAAGETGATGAAEASDGRPDPADDTGRTGDRAPSSTDTGGQGSTAAGDDPAEAAGADDRDGAAADDAGATGRDDTGRDDTGTDAAGADQPDRGAAGQQSAGADPSADEPTTVMPAASDDQGDDASGRRVTRDELYAREDRQGERERLAAIRAEHEAATAPEPAPDAVPAAAPESTTAPTGKRKKMKYPRTTDRFFPSLGLFVMRLTLAVSIGVHGVQKLLTMEQTSEFFGTLSFFGIPLPYPSILALATGVAEVLIAVSLAFGFLVRVASIGTILISVGALLMVKMTVLPNPLNAEQSGFSGDLELLIAGCGVLLLCVGGGAWALDRLFRRGRYTTDPQELAG